MLIRAVAAAVLTVLLVAGCSARPGTAAVVDGEPITQAVLAETVTELRAFSDVPPAAVLQALVVGPLWLEAAARAGVGASAGDARAHLDVLAERAGAEEQQQWGPGMMMIGRVLVAQRRAQEAGLEDQLAASAESLVNEAEIEVNPRYGEWSQVGIQPLLHEWLIASPAAGR